jgi:zinc transport system substrate-binding protein
MNDKPFLNIVCSFVLITLVFIPYFELKASDAANESMYNNAANLSNTAKLNNSNNKNNISSNTPPLKIFTSFYPIYDFVKKIGKDKIDVSVIVPAGIEPHDFEPTAKQIVDMQKASAIFINGAGFESWLKKLNNVAIIDLSKDLPLEKNGQNYNPHIWLDPILVKIQAKNILDSLTHLDPHNKLYYYNNYNQFINNLDKLDVDIVSGLNKCKLHDFLSFHDAFTYFSKRYGISQHAMQGISPEGEVPPQKIKEAIDLSKQLGIDVIFAEDHVDSRLPDLIAKEINGQVLTLSPIETISDEEKQMNKDYFSKMHDNLNNLKIALKCTS